jgi:sugar phosphate isomerase/epimerase
VTAKVLLKARPTPAQLADRLAPPRPDGLELYLDARDLAPDDWLPRLLATMAGAGAPPAGEFAYVVEGPIRSLDGVFFDVARGAPADEEALARLARFGRALGATVAVIHLIAPTSDPAGLAPPARRDALARCLPLLRCYAALCREHGLTPTIENIPPVAQMREGAAVYSALGVEPGDLVECCRVVPGLGVTFDTSHAGLYLEAVAAEAGALHASLRPVVERYAANPQARTLDEYIDLVAPWLVNVHVSNAAGLLGEGLPYGEGRFDLDAVVPRLAATARYLVTETLEPDHDRAVYMRDAQARIAALLACGTFNTETQRTRRTERDSSKVSARSAISAVNP